MKNSIYLALLLFTVSLSFSCKGKKSDGTISADDDSTYAVCLFDRASLKETPEDKGKWLEAISLGEKCEYLDDTKEDNSGGKTVKYYKIKLQGGKEGWVQANMFALSSKPAALNQDAEMYSRPDLLTKTGKMFKSMDIVAVKSTQGDFIEVMGKRKEGKWIESGWIKAGNVTYSDVDIAVAKFASKALQIKDPEKRKAAITEIVSNSDYSSSVFISELDQIINPSDSETLSEEGEAMQDGDTAPEDSTEQGD